MVEVNGEIIPTEKDITDDVGFGYPDDEMLPLNMCACGHRFNYWEFMVPMSKEYPSECPHCRRKLFFRQTIKVFEVIG